MKTDTIPRMPGEFPRALLPKRWAHLFFIVIAMACGMAAANADPAPGADLAKLWKASLQAETDRKYDDALVQVETFQKQGGDAFLAALRSGWLCYLKKDYPQATGYYTRACQLQPSAINPLLGLLNVAQAEKDTGREQSVASALLRIDPGNYRAQMSLGGLGYANKDYRTALSYYTRVLVIYPDDTDAMSGAAWAYVYLADPERAFQVFSKIVSINPDYPFAQQGYTLTAGKTSGNLSPGKLQPSSGL